MNKIKYFKIVLLMLLTVFLLSGCVSLQDLRDDHAIWKDSTRKKIIWQGKEYHYLTQSFDSYFSPEYVEWDYINVTDAGVPTLLSYWEGQRVNYSKDRNYLEESGNIYCIASKMDEMIESLESEVRMDSYAYGYYAESETSQDAFCTMSEEEEKQFEKIKEHCTEEVEWNESYEHSCFIADTYLCSDDRLFKKLDATLWVTPEGTYYLEIGENEDAREYLIPEKYYENIECIFEDAIKESDYTALYIE